MKFRQKVWMLPLVAALVFVAGSGASYVVGLSTSGALKDLRDKAYPIKESADRFAVQVDLFRTAVQAAAAEGDAAKLEEAGSAAKLAREELAKLRSLAADSEQVAKALDVYEPAALTTAKAMVSGSDAGDSMARMAAGKTALDAASNKLRADAAALVEERQAAAAGGVARGLWVQLFTGLATLVTLGIASTLVIRSVWKDLGDEPDRLRELTDRIAAGDLLAAEQDASASMDQSLRGALARMATALQATVAGIRTGAATIAHASSEIEAGNQDLSTRTERTASNLQQTASAMEQMTHNVRQTASAAQQASELARQANESANRGGEVVNGVVANMNEIADASKRIGDITGVIDSIAFQTNILALNAAVEAARAGEQGRGFAVVASEVRTLAQRSAQAAREIKQLIALSAERVDGGSRLVRDAGASMVEIVSNVQHVTRIVDEITTAAKEQSDGLSSVNESVARLDEMTQQNSALVEQSAAAAGSMLLQAQGLVQSVAVFRLRNTVGST